MEQLPTREDLYDTFQFLRSATYKGVQGIHRVASRKNSGPQVGIGIMTHGNEPSGLAALWHYKHNNELQDLLDNAPGGSVLFMLQNMEAAERYFQLPKDASFADRKNCRKIDTDMNRLPDNVLNLTEDTRSEIRRTIELAPLLDELHAGLDIHSISISNLQMAVEVKGDTAAIMEHFPIDSIITNIIAIQRGIPISLLYGGINKNVPVIGIEAGQHEDPAACRYAIECTRSFLETIGLLQKTDATAKKSPTTKEYHVVSSVMPPVPGCRMVKDFEMFEPVTENTVLFRTPEGDPVSAGMNGHILMATKKEIELPMGEEAYFLSVPVRNNGS